MVNIGKINSYPNAPHTAKALIAAKYNGNEITLNPVEMGVTNKTSEYLKKFPLGKVPSFEGADGFCLFESGAIAYYAASSKDNSPLLGADKKQNALIHQWVHFCDNELSPISAAWLYQVLGYVNRDDKVLNKAKEDCKKVMGVLNNYLLHNTYLVGDCVTLADITLFCSLVGFYRLVFEPSFRSAFPNVTRYFITLMNQPHFKAVLGEVALCEKMQQPKAPEKKAATPAKKEKPAASPAKEAPAADKPKEKNPLDLLPPSSFVMDAWKRFYSNNDTRPDAIDYFWKNYDPKGYSIFRVDYKYNDELAMTFMSANLVGGFFNRMERAKKYCFGSLAILGEDNKNSIAGYFVCRGSEVPFEITDAADYESYTFTKVNTEDKKVRELINAYFAWDDKIEGKPFADGKIFK